MIGSPSSLHRRVNCGGDGACEEPTRHAVSSPRTACASTQVGLAAGGLIYTGTPAGVAAVVKDDTLVGTIAGLEELTIRVV